MKEAIWISIGAILGANARYFIGGLLAEAAKSTFPVGTLVINVSGYAVLGFFMALTTGKLVVDPAWRVLVAVGFCGTYTTFSTFAYESVSLLCDGQWVGFAVNVLATNALCLLGMIAGIKLGSQVSAALPPEPPPQQREQVDKVRNHDSQHYSHEENSD